MYSSDNFIALFWIAEFSVVKGVWPCPKFCPTPLEVALQRVKPLELLQVLSAAALSQQLPQGCAVIKFSLRLSSSTGSSAVGKVKLIAPPHHPRCNSFKELMGVCLTRFAFLKPMLAGVNYPVALNFLIISQHLSKAIGSRANP